jgi:hypothetical protein
VSPTPPGEREGEVRRRFVFTSVVIVLIVVLYVGIAAAAAGPFALDEIIRERSPLAWLSCMLLTGAAMVAVILGMRPEAPAAFFLLGAGLFALALDERFMGHERVKELIRVHLFHHDRAAMGVWGNLPLLAVPLVGGWVLWKLRRELQTRPCRTLLLCALGVSVLAVFLDIAELGRWGQLSEELSEIAAETLFLLAMLAVFIQPPVLRPLALMARFRV